MPRIRRTRSELPWPLGVFIIEISVEFPKAKFLAGVPHDDADPEAVDADVTARNTLPSIEEDSPENLKGWTRHVTLNEQHLANVNMSFTL